MTALSMAFDDALQSGACVAVPRHVAWAAALARRAVRAATDPLVKDYCLTDLDGRRVGTVPAALVRPTLGAQRPTVYLHRRFN